MRRRRGPLSPPPVKPSSFVLLASLAANAALLAVFALRPASAPEPTRPSAIPSAATATAASSGGRDSALRAALASGDARELEAAGVDPTLARELALGRTLARLVARARTEKAAATDGRWWRSPAPGNPAREQQALLRRELSDAFAAAFGDDGGLLGGGMQAAHLAFLPPAKREALRRINLDYEEMMAKFSAGGVQLASDRERLKLLREERERDIAAVLSPEERLAYELRTSPTASLVRARYGDGIETEEDFRRIYALQKAFDEKFPAETLRSRSNPEGMRAYAEAQRQLQEDIRAAVGEPAYAVLRRATDSDLRTVDSLVSRLNLPPATTDRVAAARETFAAESQRLAADPALNPAQRRAQLQELGTRARAEVQQALGTEAAEAYAQRSPWLSMLQGGVAYSTTPPANSPVGMLGGNQSVYPVLPAPTGAPGAARQMVFTGAATTVEAGVSPGDSLLGGAAPVVRENVQVMTFSTATTDPSRPASEGGTAAPAPGTPRTIIVAPPPPATTPPPR